MVYIYIGIINKHEFTFVKTFKKLVAELGNIKYLGLKNLFKN